MENAWLTVNGLPNSLGVLLEFVRQSGKYNMLVDFGKALFLACQVGLYLGQIGNEWMKITDNYREVFTEYNHVYFDKRYLSSVVDMVKGLPYSLEYQNACEVYEKKYNPLTTSKMLIEKVSDTYLKLGKQERDNGNMKVQTTDKTDLIMVGMQIFANRGMHIPNII